MHLKFTILTAWVTLILYPSKTDPSTLDSVTRLNLRGKADSSSLTEIDSKASFTKVVQSVGLCTMHLEIYIWGKSNTTSIMEEGS